MAEKEDLQVRELKLKWIADVWGNWAEIRNEALNGITNYLFVLNTGGLLGALTYVASKEVTCEIQATIYLFAFGIACSLSHATLDYYASEKCFEDYKNDVSIFYEGKLDWLELAARNERRPRLDWLLHMFGWFGGIAFLIGLFIGINQIAS